MSVIVAKTNKNYFSKIKKLWQCLFVFKTVKASFITTVPQSPTNKNEHYLSIMERLWKRIKNWLEFILEAGNLYRLNNNTPSHKYIAIL